MQYCTSCLHSKKLRKLNVRTGLIYRNPEISLILFYFLFYFLLLLVKVNKLYILLALVLHCIESEWNKRMKELDRKILFLFFSAVLSRKKVFLFYDFLTEKTLFKIIKTIQVSNTARFFHSNKFWYSAFLIKLTILFASSFTY